MGVWAYGASASNSWSLAVQFISEAALSLERAQPLIEKGQTYQAAGGG